MGRFWIGLVLLLGFLILGFWVSHRVQATQLPISRQLEEASRLAQSGAAEDAFALAQQAHAAWQKHWHGIACVADHTPMDEIDSLFAQLEVWATPQTRIRFAACCAQLSRRIHAIGEGQSFTWWNLL